MERRYQVFISSTSRDLEDERRAVIDALLEASYIPVGMELFNAAAEAAWPTIERIVSGCDYYIVIVAGRYGSVRDNGVSFTESEYDHAKMLGKPRLAFLHENPGTLPRERTETSALRSRQLDSFRERLEQELMCRFWSNKDQLAHRVVAALHQAVQTHPMPGWMRSDSADGLPDELQSSLITPSQGLGIRYISADGQARPELSRRLARARSISIMSTSAVRLIEIQKPYLVEALTHGCDIRVLVPELESQFLRDVEESESEHARREPISPEIKLVSSRLVEALGEAAAMFRIEQLGHIRIGHFTTHLRSTMTLCDDSWGWLTLTLPPARAPETASFEIADEGTRPLLRSCRRHFERTWTIAESRGTITTLTPAAFTATVDSAEQ